MNKKKSEVEDTEIENVDALALMEAIRMAQEEKEREKRMMKEEKYITVKDHK